MSPEALVRAHPLISLVLAQLALEVVLAAAVGGLLGNMFAGTLAMMGAMGLGGFVVGRSALVTDEASTPDRIRSLARWSGVVHALLGSVLEGAVLLVWAPWRGPAFVVAGMLVSGALVGAMAWVLSQSGLSVGVWARRR